MHYLNQSQPQCHIIMIYASGNQGVVQTEKGVSNTVTNHLYNSNNWYDNQV